MCQRVMIIHQGRLVADDTMAALKAHAGRVRLELEWDQEPNWEALKQIPGVASVEPRDACTAVVEAADERDLRSVLFDWSVQEGLRVLRMEVPAGRNLEAVFRELTRTIPGGQTASSVQSKAS